MSKVPSLSYEKVITALKRDGWIVVRQRGSHIRLQKRTRDEVLKLTVSEVLPQSGLRTDSPARQGGEGEGLRVKGKDQNQRRAPAETLRRGGEGR